MEASKSPFTYLLIKIEGEEKERFLNLCRHNNIGLWDIVIKDEGISAKIKRNDFFNMKNIKHKAHVKIKVVKKRMLRYTFFKYRKHYAFALGIFIAAVFVKIMSLFIWNISFEGNSMYTDSALRKYLNELDINTGILINDVDCEYIETSMRNNYFAITWVSCEIRGTRLVVHIKESDSDIIPDDIILDSSIDYDNVTADNLVASEDGNVVSIITRNGTPFVKAGDNVQKGDVLVSGIVEMTDDSGTVIKQIGVKTDADVLLSTSLQYENSINMNYEKKIYTGKNKTKRILIIANKRIELCLNPMKLKECDVITDYSDIKLNEEFYLPVIYGVKQYKEYEKQLAALEYDEAENILNEKFNAYLCKLEENGVQIVDYRVNINILEDSYQMTGNINVTFKESAKISAEFDDNIINEQGD